MAAIELAVRDHALTLGADVDEDLVLVDADDAALDDVAVLEALDVGFLLGEELLHRRRLGAERDRTSRPRIRRGSRAIRGGYRAIPRGSRAVPRGSRATRRCLG